MKKSILQRMAHAEIKATQPSGEEATEGGTPVKRHSSPVISNVGRALSHLSEESIVSLDPRKVERSPFQDRFEEDVEAEDALEALKQSILSEGQKIPVLVRPHPTNNGHYQLAYGRRRLAAIRSIMEDSDRPEAIKIKAYVRNLSDRQLIEEQSVENGVRENLTWIEQAMWAVQLKQAGLTHRNICPILGLSEAGVSQLFRVTSAIPADIIYSIGRAKSVGRPKWTALAELFKDSSKLANAHQAIKMPEFAAADGQGRIALLMRTGNSKKPADLEQKLETVEITDGHRVLGQAKRTPKGLTLTVSKKETAFANWLVSKLPQLAREYSLNAEDRSSSD